MSHGKMSTRDCLRLCAACDEKFLANVMCRLTSYSAIPRCAIWRGYDRVQSPRCSPSAGLANENAPTSVNNFFRQLAIIAAPTGCHWMHDAMPDTVSVAAEW